MKRKLKNKKTKHTLHNMSLHLIIKSLKPLSQSFLKFLALLNMQLYEFKRILELLYYWICMNKFNLKIKMDGFAIRELNSHTYPYNLKIKKMYNIKRLDQFKTFKTLKDLEYMMV